MTLTAQKFTTDGLIKWAFASIIIVMASYGYCKFFYSPESGWEVGLIVALFCILEIAILAMTTKNFSSAVSQQRSVGVGLYIAIIFMWFISGVGIDKTIWSMLESKYHNVAVEKGAIEAEKETEQLLSTQLNKLENNNLSYQTQIDSLEKDKVKAQKEFRKASNHLNNTIYNNGSMCATNDCLARKKEAEGRLDMTKKVLDDYILHINQLRKKIMLNDEDIAQRKTRQSQIVDRRVMFEQKNSVTMQNQEEEALLHTGIMHLFNNIFGMNITTPQRAYVMLLSFIVYPGYILFLMFVASNSDEMVEKRRVLQKKKESQNKQKSTSTNYLRKAIYYFIKTRKRKVVTKEVEIEVEVIKEVETIVYKDGKEIVKVEVEVPHIIEKEVVVEKIVEKPIVQKEFIVVPADVDLNKLNELSKSGSSPAKLEEVLKNMSKNKSIFNIPVEANNDKHRAA